MIHRTPHPRRLIWAALLSLTLLHGACAVISGLDNFELVSECAPGTVEPCYTGPPGTNNVGPCHSGTHTCEADEQWGPCFDDAVPAPEDCTSPEEDEDCDGHTAFSDGDPDCACEPGATQSCYTGPDGTEDVGVCHGGTQSCNDDGLAWGTCENEVTPAANESCTTSEDEDCDGHEALSEADPDCSCEPGTTEPCYSGAPGTEGVGPCHGGTRTCNAEGIGWSICNEVAPTPEVCGNAVLDEDCSGTPCGGDALWAVKIDGSGNQFAQDLVVDSIGGIVVVGYFTGSMTAGAATLTSAGSNDVFVVKLDPTGTVLWAKRFGNNYDQRATSVAVDSTGNIFVTGYFGGSMAAGGTILTSAGGNDVFVLKLDPTGTVLWGKGYGDSADQYAMGIAVTDQGDPVLTGRFFGTIDFGIINLTSGGDTDVFVANLAGNNGACVWSYSYGGADSQNGSSIAVGEGVFLTGSVDGSFIIGTDAINAGAYSDILAANLSTNGPASWAQSFGGAASVSDNFGHDIAVDDMNNVLLAGEFAGCVNFGGSDLCANGGGNGFVARLTSTGQHEWSKAFGDSIDLILVSRGVAADTAGNVLLTGHFSGTADFGGAPVTSSGTDLFVAKLSPNGNHLWSRRFGDAADQFGVSVASAPAGDVLVAGYFKGTLDFNTGGTSLTANGNNNTLFVAKLAR
jgi:hypothetical protein